MIELVQYMFNDSKNGAKTRQYLLIKYRNDNNEVRSALLYKVKDTTNHNTYLNIERDYNDMDNTKYHNISEVMYKLELENKYANINN
jgi:hypothetical protein